MPTPAPLSAARRLRRNRAALVHVLHVSGLLALEPQLLARASSSTRRASVRWSCASASRFIHANISTSPLPASCAITGTRPFASHLTFSSPARVRQFVPVTRFKSSPRCLVGHEALGFADRVFAVVEDAGGQHRVGVAFDDAVGQMLQRSRRRPTRSPESDTASRHRARQREVEAALRAVAVHAGQQDFAGAEFRHLARPLDGVESGVLAPAVREDFPARRFARGADALGVDGDDDALRAVLVATRRARAADSPPPRS